MIFEHGSNPVAYGMAVQTMRKVIELNPEADKWLLAAAIDRDLVSRGKPQVYGTQSSLISNFSVSEYSTIYQALADEAELTATLGKADAEQGNLRSMELLAPFVAAKAYYVYARGTVGELRFVY